MFTIVGLGNPGAEYTDTRHNTGRIVVEAIARACGVEMNVAEWKKDVKLKALTAEGKTSGGEKIKCILPETFMNKSGQSVLPIIGVVGSGKHINAAAAKKAEQLIVVYDDLDLPIGRMKISFNRSAGGHHGVESIIKALKTEAFVRIRVGISGKTPTGKMKKPAGDVAVQDFILGKFKDAELAELKKVAKRACEAVEMIAGGGSTAKGMRMAREKAMGEFNQG